MKSKTKIIFISANVLIIIIACVHVLTSYFAIANDLSTSFPAYIAFFLTIPYGLILAAYNLAWLIVHKIIKRRSIANKEKPC